MMRLKGVHGRKGPQNIRRKASCRSSVNAEPVPRIPDSAKIVWRVLSSGTRLDGLQSAHCETPFEREALAAYRDLRQRGFPAVVSRWQIYRVRIRPRRPLDSERFAFVEAYSEDDACSRVAFAFTGFDRCALNDIRLRVSARSYEACRLDGMSTDPEFRLFETDWSGGRITGWVREPMFLLPEPSGLTRKWSSIPQRSAQ